MAATSDTNINGNNGNITFQSYAHQSRNEEIKNYALFLGGLNVTHDALLQYDPLITGFGRIFMTRKPVFVEKQLGQSMGIFKHILEYANTGISGNSDIEMGFVQMNGGYTNRQVDIPTVQTDNANELTIKTFEFSGSPVREVIQYWLNGIADLQSGYTTYNGAAYPGATNYVPVNQANQSAEFWYVHTDRSGQNVEYAAMWANCVPKRVPFAHFDYESGQHELVPMEVTFTGVRYMGPQINDKARQLLAKYNVLYNSLNFHPGYTDQDLNQAGNGSYYDMHSGKLVEKSASQNGTFIFT